MTLRWTAAAAALLALRALSAEAQERFTTQVMIVPAFRGTDRGLAAKAADIVRARVASAYQRQELRVISGGDVEDWLRRSGFDEQTQLSEGELRELAKKFRADERITGVATRIGGKNGRVRLDAELALIRDLRMSQPLTAEAANVDEAADLLGRDAAAARRQLVPLRQCENAAREGKPAAAIAAATTAIAAYARAVPARICLLNALARLDVTADSVIAVANAILDVAPGNPVALEALAQALDSQHKQSAAAPVWERLLATDSSSEELLDKVVNALARGGNAKRAEPLIDRGTDAHPDNLPLLKLRWLVHLATNDWSGATHAGERLLARDIAAQGDPDFFSRLASAYRADSQPSRALSVAASGVARFPKDAGIYVTYLQMLRAESDAALPRGLVLFPENAELHVLAAQTFKATGNSAAALDETRRAIAANPRLPHGYLQLAQLEMDAGLSDSALVHAEKAPDFGEDPTTVSQFALARGNALYKAATASQKRDDFRLAIRFLTLAERLAPSTQAKFLLGASALSVSQSAATEAAPVKSCELSKLAETSLTDAEINLVAGGAAAPDAAKQFLEYVGKLRPYVSDQLKSFCTPVP